MADPMDWQTDKSNIYPVSSQCDKKRLAVIIYTTENRSPYGLADRKLLEKLWINLKFKVISIPDPSLIELGTAVNNIVSIVDKNPDEHDMICICFIGHGGRKENHVGGLTYTFEYFCLKDGIIEIDKLRALFSTNKCKGLAGVPKFLFAQCCRGICDEIPSELFASEVIPENVDFLTLNACISGNRAIYNIDSGQSAFINTMCSVFERDFMTEDILSMATRVVNEIKDKRQTPELKSTLRKKVYFSGVRSDILPRFIRTRTDLKLQYHSPASQDSPPDEPARSLNTRESNEFSILNQEQNGMDVRELIMKVDHKDDFYKVKKLSFGQPSNKPTKVILLVGQTKTGKTTLINAIINYIFGVKFEDNFRYIMTDDKDWITAYVINHIDGMLHNYNYVLIETPGFANTGGIQRDREMMQQLEMFLEQSYGIDHVDAVGLVVLARTAVLTKTQRYVFNGLTSIFGRDIKDNMFVMATCADDKHPPVIEALQKADVQFTDYYKFHNSALYARNKNPATNDDYVPVSNNAFSWGVGYQSINNMFLKLESTSPVSLKLTKEVLNVRSKLHSVLEDMGNKINLRGNSLSYLIQQAQQHLRRVDDIALKPYQLSTLIGYIDLMTKTETKNKKQDYERRIKQLKKEADVLKLLINNQ